jgi:hypothetical protein
MVLAQNDAVEVRSGFLGLGVFARRDMPLGAVLAEGWGSSAPCRTRHSVQVDFGTHLHVEPPLVYVNHSCDPNCALLIDRGKKLFQLRALRPLSRGEEVSIDYDTFEYEIHFMPEQCLCGSQNCRGRVSGFKHLTAGRAEQLMERFGIYVAEYLRRDFAMRPLDAALPVGRP